MAQVGRGCRSYTPPRLARWPIVVGILLFAGWIAALVAVPAAVSSSSSGYALTATDAHFMATFPARPDRAANAVGTTTIIVYTAALPDHAVGVTYVALPASASFSPDGAVNGAASSQPGGKVISRNSLTYLGQPAEDAAIKFSGGFLRIRVVTFGSSAYILEGAAPRPPPSSTTTTFCLTLSAHSNEPGEDLFLGRFVHCRPSGGRQGS